MNQGTLMNHGTFGGNITNVNIKTESFITILLATCQINQVLRDMQRQTMIQKSES